MRNKIRVWIGGRLAGKEAAAVSKDNINFRNRVSRTDAVDKQLQRIIALVIVDLRSGFSKNIHLVPD